MGLARHFWTVTALLAWATSSSAGERLLLNEATSEQLASLDQVEPWMGDAIVSLREKRGSLNSVEELRVMGLSSDALESLRGGTAIEVEATARTEVRPETVDQVLARFDHEPSVRELQVWATEYASVQPEQVQRWLRSSRLFAALPELRFEYKLRDGWDNDYAYYATDFVVDTPDEEVFPVLDDAGIDQDLTITVKATWDLDKLIMSSEQIRVINEAQDVVKLRDKILVEATRLYFERRRLQVDMMLDPKRDLQGQIDSQLRLMELTANLDAVTGGRFSEALTRVN